MFFRVSHSAIMVAPVLVMLSDNAVAGTQPGETVVMRGRGIQRLNGRGKGSQYVHWSVTIPKSLTEIQRKLLEEFQAEEVCFFIVT